MMRCFSEMREGRKRVTIAMVLLTVFAITVLFVMVLAAPTATNFGVDDTSGASGTYVLVPVNITTAQNGPIAGIGFDISYNNSVISVVGIQAGSLASGWDFSTGYANYPWGTTVAIVYNGSGTEIGDNSTGSVVMLNFSVVGAPDTTSLMNLTNIQLADLSGNVGSAPAKNGTFTVTPIPISLIFDTGSPANPYPSIFGTHNGKIIPDKDITVNRMYTYPCEGTGGHSEYAMIWNETDCVEAYWDRYIGDYHNISFNRTLTLRKGVIYNYTIQTGSYPQIIHAREHKAVEGGNITCTEFRDANGKIYYDWIPAIKLIGKEV